MSTYILTFSASFNHIIESVLDNLSWNFSGILSELLQTAVVLLMAAGLGVYPKGPVKLIKRVKIAHSFLHTVSNQFHVISLSLPM